MKKEISDKIAQAFFDNKARKKKKNNLPLVFVYAVLGLIFCSFFMIRSLNSQGRNKNIQPLGSVIFEKPDGPYTLSFDFSNGLPKKVSLNIDIQDLNLEGYVVLKFRVKLKNSSFKKENCLKVGFVNSRHEVSYVYIKNIADAWKTVELKLSDFSKIYDWSQLEKLTFTLEEWNLGSKKGELLIDEVEFFK